MSGSVKVIYFSVGLEDPLTKEPLTTPVRSFDCQPHDAYEESSIKVLLDSQEGPIMCPLCQAPITHDSLTVDYELLDFLEANQPIGKRKVIFHIETSDYLFLDQITSNSTTESL